MRAASSQAPDDPPRTESRFRIVEVLVVFLVFFVVGGAAPPHVNESHYLVKAKHFWDPSWCPGDLFLDSADPHLLFYWTIGALTQWFALPTVAWIGRSVAWLGLAAAWCYLSRQVLPRPWFSVLTAAWFAVLMEYGHFAGEWVLGGIESKCLAFVFVFWGLAEMCRGRWLRVWPLLGIGAAFHVLVGGWAVVAALVVWMMEERDARPGFFPMLPSLVLGGICSLPGVLPGFMLSRGVTTEIQNRANEIYVFERLPHHLAPLTLGGEELIRRGGSFLVVVVVLIALWYRRREHIPLQLRRLLHYAAAGLAIALLGLMWELAMWNHPTLAAKLLKFYWFRLADVAVPLALTFSLVEMLSATRESSSPGARLQLALLALCPAVVIASIAFGRWFDGTAPANRQVAETNAWKAACIWVRENTAADALFLIPRMAQSFKWYAQRADHCNWKDIPQDPRSLVEWYDRCDRVFMYENDFGERVPHSRLGYLGTEAVRQLGQEAGIDYVLAEEYPPLQLPVVYENAWYKIYQISPAGNDE